MNSYYFLNLGCPKNRVDGDYLRGDLQRLGLIESAKPDTADYLFVNSCAFIESARRETVGEIEALIKGGIKRSAEVILVGCYPALPEAELEISGISKAIPFDRYDELLDYLAARTGTCRRPEKPRRVSPDSYFAYVKIADGCNNRCAYCRIPSIRGEYRSEAFSSIIGEAAYLAERGVKEIILVAQDSTLYGTDLDRKYDLADICREIGAIDGIEWIRLMYAHPAHLDLKLMERAFSCAKVCRYLDMPIQHISDKILKRMNRASTSRMIRDKIKWLRSFDNELSLRTSLMVGFPGESDDDFRMLLDFTEEMRFDHVGVFAFSPERGTMASRLDDRIDPELVQERQELLMETTSRITEEIERSLIGKIELMFIESLLADDPGQFEARSCRQAPEIDGFYRVERKKSVSPGSFHRIMISDLNQGVFYD